MIYLDGAATALPVSDYYEAAGETARHFPGNPSSGHALGKAARRRLEELRAEAARLLGAGLPERVVFTSGGTEANNLVLTGFLERPYTGQAVTSAMEHASAREPLSTLERAGWSVTEVRPDKRGVVSPEALRKKLSRETRLVSVHLVNGEMGAVQPVAELVGVVRDWEREVGRPIHFHTDAVQALGKFPFSLEELGVDSAAFSGHKLGAPRGVGILFCRSPLSPLYKGGGQERGLRSGTENLPGIAGFTAAMKDWLDAGGDGPGEDPQELMDFLISRLRELPGCRILPEERLVPGGQAAKPETDSERFSPWILAAAFPPVPGEVLLRVLDNREICISTGSACASNRKKKEGQRSLRAMGLDGKILMSAVRISLDRSTSREDLEGLISVLNQELPVLGRVKS